MIPHRGYRTFRIGALRQPYRTAGHLRLDDVPGVYLVRSVCRWLPAAVQLVSAPGQVHSRYTRGRSGGHDSSYYCNGAQAVRRESLCAWWSIWRQTSWSGCTSGFQAPGPEHAWSWSRWRRKRQYQARICHYKRRAPGEPSNRPHHALAPKCKRAPARVTAGVDWAKNDQVICVTSGQGVVLEQFTVRHDAAGLRQVASQQGVP